MHIVAGCPNSERAICACHPERCSDRTTHNTALHLAELGRVCYDLGDFIDDVSLLVVRSVKRNLRANRYLFA